MMQILTDGGPSPRRRGGGLDGPGSLSFSLAQQQISGIRLTVVHPIGP